jgi:hypothetical protein
MSMKSTLQARAERWLDRSEAGLEGLEGIALASGGRLQAWVIMPAAGLIAMGVVWTNRMDDGIGVVLIGVVGVALMLPGIVTLLSAVYHGAERAIALGVLGVTGRTYD